MKAINWLYSIIKTIILLTVIILGVAFIYPLLPIGREFKIFTVQSGSMEPTITTGSVILVKELSSYEIGDIITRKAGPSSEATVTHRLIEEEEKEGDIRFRTKGDANEDADNMTFSFEDIIGQVLFNIPYLGYPINFIKTPHGFILAVVIPATILIYEELRKIKHELAKNLSARKEKRKQKKKGRKSRKRTKDPKEKTHPAEKIKSFEFGNKIPGNYNAKEKD